MRPVRASSVWIASITLTVTVLATGIPVSAETDHDDLGAHIESGHGGHGIGLIQSDLKVERAAPIGIPLGAVPCACLEPAAPRSAGPSQGDTHRPRSRAPPAPPARAPPPST